MPKSYISSFSVLLLSLSNCVLGNPDGQQPDGGNPVQVYQCDGLDFTVEHKDEHEVWIFLPDFSGPLPRIESASGTRYEANNITFWSKGEEASLSYGNEQYKNCRNNPALAVWEKAKLSGVDFRAVGNEPAWVLEIRGDELWLFRDYGAQQTHFTHAEQSTEPDKALTTYRAQSGGETIQVTLRGESCQDSMADESYETTVTIEIDDRTLQGCGKALH